MKRLLIRFMGSLFLLGGIALLHLCWVVISYFAIVGLFECILELMDWYSFRKTRSAESVMLVVTLKGDVKNVEYLLNTLCLKAERTDVGNAEAGLTVLDGGLSKEAREQVLCYCEKNPWVIFTEKV